MNDLNVQKKKVHRCSICRKNFFWNDESCWFGQWVNKKGNEKILEKCCSRNCFKKSKYRREDPEFLNE